MVKRQERNIIRGEGSIYLADRQRFCGSSCHGRIWSRSGSVAAVIIMYLLWLPPVRRELQLRLQRNLYGVFALAWGSSTSVAHSDASFVESEIMPRRQRSLSRGCILRLGWARGGRHGLLGSIRDLCLEFFQQTKFFVVFCVLEINMAVGMRLSRINPTVMKIHAVFIIL